MGCRRLRRRDCTGAFHLVLLSVLVGTAAIVVVVGGFSFETTGRRRRKLPPPPRSSPPRVTVSSPSTSFSSAFSSRSSRLALAGGTAVHSSNYHRAVYQGNRDNNDPRGGGGGGGGSGGGGGGVVSTSKRGTEAGSNSSDRERDDDDIRRPPGTDNPWEVHKFGGASLATAELYRTVGDLLVRESAGRDLEGADDGSDDGGGGDGDDDTRQRALQRQRRKSAKQSTTTTGPIPTCAVVSARAGMTDLLVRVVDSALEDFDSAKRALNEAVNSQIALLRELVPDGDDNNSNNSGASITDPIEARFRNDGNDILSVVQSLRMLKTVPAVTMEVVTGYGEVWSAQTLHAYLRSRGVPAAWIDARDVLVVRSDPANVGLGEKGSAASTAGVEPMYEETAEKLSAWWNNGVAGGGGARGLLLRQQKQQQRQQSREDDDDDKGDGASAGGPSASAAPVPAPVVVVTGFVAATADGVRTTLKRSGSDYSATIFGKLLAASRVTMWKNTDGVYTADPRRVPEAFSIRSLKYDEAMELAYFGAQVLHPSAMIPCIDESIPVYVRNIFNPSFPGTVISGRCATLGDSLKRNDEDGGDSAREKTGGGVAVANWRSKAAGAGGVPVKGITSVDSAALVTLEGASIGGARVADRFMGAMADGGIDVLIITQASSESSITVAVPEDQADCALAALEDAFALELSRSTANGRLSAATGMAIVAIVGEGMALTSGVSATFMGSLARANVNIRLIAQGSSERQIAVVVDRRDASRAVRAVHMAFTLSLTSASVAVLGCTGDIGSSLVRQLRAQKEALKEELDVAACVNLAATSKKMALCRDSSAGLDLARLPELLLAEASDEKNGDDNDRRGSGGRGSGNSSNRNRRQQKDDDVVEDFSLERVTQILKDDVNPLRVVIDCTNTEEVAEYYERWLSEGINVICTSQRVASGRRDRYDRVLEAQKRGGGSWLYEGSVGSALPICNTLRDLFETGDHVKEISGCMSGTMAYVLSAISDDVSFSEAVRQAARLRITESDLREDLSGHDMASKVVVLARRLGLDVNLQDVEVESLIPDEIANKSYPEASDRRALTEAIVKDLRPLDGPMLERLKAARADGDKKLRYKFQIDKATGMCRCRLVEVGTTSPLYRLKLNENLVAFETGRYATSPLIVKGASAGPDLAASAMFADLLRLTRAYSSQQG